MKLLLASCVAGLTVLAIYISANPGVVSAHSPDIRPAATGVTIIEEDEGYYNDPVTKSTEVSVRISPTVKGDGAPPTYATVPGMNAAQVELLHELRQSPKGYLDDLRSTRLATEEDGEDEARIPGSALDLLPRGLPTGRPTTRRLPSTSCANSPD